MLEIFFGCSIILSFMVTVLCSCLSLLIFRVNAFTSQSPYLILNTTTTAQFSSVQSLSYVRLLVTP